jgi:thymidylate synthase (FAD)
MMLARANWDAPENRKSERVQAWRIEKWLETATAPKAAPAAPTAIPTEIESLLIDTPQFCPNGWESRAALDRVTAMSSESSPKSEHFPIQFKSEMTVELVKASASDSDVIWAARVSTAGDKSLDDVDSDATRAEGLINYLARERHGSPFEHTSMTFFISAPIFVFREFMRHRIASYNEESGRYRELRPNFYVPGPERKLVQIGKAGAYTFVDGTPEQYELTVAAIKESCEVAYGNYTKMLDAGVAREVARAVLPVTLYSSMYVTMNARALMNFLSLRTAREGSHFPSYPQREIEMVAEQMEAHFATLMPITYAAFEKSGRIAP